MSIHMGNGNGNGNINDNGNGIDYESVIEIYHSLCPKMNKVVVINNQRKGYINARITEFGIDKVASVLRMAGESSFLNGQNDKAWKADFEWIMRPQNFVKIMEGKYVAMKQDNNDLRVSTKYIDEYEGNRAK